MKHNGSVIVAFHGIGTPARRLEPGEDRFWLSERRFEDVLDRVQQGLAAGRDIRLTFDDGNASDVSYGLPSLLQRGLTATFFVISGRIDQPGSLAAADLAALTAGGMRVGTHGESHRRWRQLATDELRGEIERSCLEIHRASGTPVREASFPLGSYGRHSLAALRAYNFDHVYSVAGGSNRRGAWLQHRTSLMHTHSMQEVDNILSGRSAAGYGLTRGLKRVARRLV